MIWVFGYGSLTFRPEFAYARREPALLRGYHRCYCSYSVKARGTPEAPGLMMNLAPGGQCWGIAYGAEGDQARAMLEYLDRREGEGRSNRRVMLPLQLGRGNDHLPFTHGWTYLPSASNPNFCGLLPFEQMAAVLATCRGRVGTGYEYLTGVIRELAAFHIREPFLDMLLEAVENEMDRSGAAAPVARRA